MTVRSTRRMKRTAYLMTNNQNYEDPTVQTEEERIVENLAILVEDIHSQTNLLVEVLFNAHRDHKIIEVQSFVLETVQDMLQGSRFAKYHARCKERLLAVGAPTLVLEIMSKEKMNSSIQSLGCNILRIFASKSDENRPLIVEAGATKSLVKALQNHSGNHNVVRNALSCLRILSKEVLCRECLQPYLSDLLPCVMGCHLKSATIQRDACAVLSNSAVDISTQKVSNVPSSALQATVEAMEQHMDDNSVLSIACFALKNFTCNEVNLQSLADLHAISIIEMAATIGEDYVPNAQAVVSRLAGCTPSAKPLSGSENDLSDASLDVVDLLSGEGDAVSALLDMIEANASSAAYVATGLQGLRSIAMEPNQRGKINSAVVMKVIALLRKYKDDADVQASGFEVLTEVANDGNVNRDVILSANGVSALLESMERHPDSQQVQIAASGALSSLSKDFECWFQIQQQGSSQSWSSAVERFPKSDRIRSNCEEIAMNFSIHESMMS